MTTRQRKTRTGLAGIFFTTGISLVKWHFTSLRSTYGDQRNLLVLFIACNARGLRIKHRLSVHQEAVLMVTVRQGHLEEPPTVHPPFHGKGSGIPVIEIACERYQFCFGRGAVKIDRFSHYPRRISDAVRICL